MTRLLVENDWQFGRGGDAAASPEDETSPGRSGRSISDEGRSRARRPREDPSGRRSLTGLEFRRQRSI